jgi:hypothetical protein
VRLAELPDESGVPVAVSGCAARGGAPGKRSGAFPSNAPLEETC